MKKCWKWLLAVVAILLAGLLIWFLVDYFSIPRLPPWEKEKVVQEHTRVFGEDEICYHPIIWYDENGYVEENYVWRYIGKYGDCYAFLEIGDNYNMAMEKMELPCPIGGLVDSPVYYPVEAQIVLYHTKQKFTPNDVFDHSYADDADDSSRKLWYLIEVEKRNVLLTDEQLEKLTRDVEKIAKEHN